MAKQSIKAYRTVGILHVFMSSGLAECPPHADTEWGVWGRLRAGMDILYVLCLPPRERQILLTSDPWLSHYTDREERTVY